MRHTRINTGYRKPSDRNNHNNRRMKRAARKWSFWAVSALFVLIVGISVFSMTAKAKSSAGMDETLYYTSYTIRSSETLWSICEDHADPDHYKNTKEYFKTVIELNQISDTEYIESGNHLVLPYYK